MIYQHPRHTNSRDRQIALMPLAREHMKFRPGSVGVLLALGVLLGLAVAL